MIKKNDKIGSGYVNEVKKDKGAVTVTISPEPQPNWEEIALDMANIIDDVFIFFNQYYGDQNKELPSFQFMKKKFIQSTEYFRNDSGIVKSIFQIDAERKAHQNLMHEFLKQK